MFSADLLWIDVYVYPIRLHCIVVWQDDDWSYIFNYRFFWFFSNLLKAFIYFFPEFFNFPVQIIDPRLMFKFGFVYCNNLFTILEKCFLSLPGLIKGASHWREMVNYFSAIFLCAAILFHPAIKLMGWFFGRRKWR